MVQYIIQFEPPEGFASCGVGNAFICSADDECGTNTSENIQYKQTTGEDSKFDDNSGCYYLQPGVLSKLVIFANKLFANITTDSEGRASTLIGYFQMRGMSQYLEMTGEKITNFKLVIIRSNI